MSLSQAIAVLTGLSVTGVTKSYTLDTMPGGQPPGADLPCLLPVPTGAETNRDKNSYGRRTAPGHIIRHRLLVSPVQQARKQGEAIASLVTLVDNYYTAAANASAGNTIVNYYLNDYEFGVVEWGGVAYYGVDFQWIIKDK